MKKKNYTWYLWGMLLSTFAIISLLYWLPDNLFGVPLQKVDIFSELRHSDADAPNGKEVEQLTRNSATADGETEKEIKERDAIYEDLKKQDATLENKEPIEPSSPDKEESDSTPKVYFEDFNSSHLGLRNTYAALAKRKIDGAPLRIAFLGDSFIEADIFTLDLRKFLQSRYGGGGAGWMPFSSEVSGYRQGITHSFSGWKDHFIIRQSKDLYPLTGHYYTCEGAATLQYKVAKGYTPWDCATIFYTSNKEVQVTMSSADTTQRCSLPPSAEMNAYAIKGQGGEMKLSFSGAEGAKFYGVALDNTKQSGGVILDNFSHRGSSGFQLGQIDTQLGKRFASLRPYHLIVLQYGLNVASDKTKDYTYYTNRMGEAIDHLKKLYPHTDIVIMGVSDRAKRSGGEPHTMPAIYALRNAQRKLASEKGIVFWDTFEAMGGENSMGRFVKQGWAAKDYTHLSFKGGKRLAEVFYNSFLFEEKYYQRIRR